MVSTVFLSNIGKNNEKRQKTINRHTFWPECRSTIRLSKTAFSKIIFLPRNSLEKQRHFTSNRLRQFLGKP